MELLEQRGIGNKSRAETAKPHTVLTPLARLQEGAQKAAHSREETLGAPLVEYRRLVKFQNKSLGATIDRRVDVLPGPIHV